MQSLYLPQKPFRMIQDLMYRALKSNTMITIIMHLQRLQTTVPKPSDEINVTLNTADKTFGTTSLPQLASGESKDITVPFEIDKADFNNLGYIDFKLSAVSGENTSNAYTMFISHKPLIAEINDGAENVSLNGKKMIQQHFKQSFPLE